MLIDIFTQFNWQTNWVNYNCSCIKFIFIAVKLLLFFYEKAKCFLFYLNAHSFLLQKRQKHHN